MAVGCMCGFAMLHWHYWHYIDISWILGGYYFAIEWQKFTQALYIYSILPHLAMLVVFRLLRMVSIGCDLALCVAMVCDSQWAVDIQSDFTVFVFIFVKFAKNYRTLGMNQQCMVNIKFRFKIVIFTLLSSAFYLCWMICYDSPVGMSANVYIVWHCPGR